MKLQNPIVRGVYPDPSVCRANGKYYMVCSSFEYFPGVPLFESDDLVNWHQIGHCLTRKTQVDLHQIASSGGVFAPTIRFHDGVFYMVTTNDTYHKNFYVTTTDIYGEWSEPIFVDQGGIDPSLFFEDGKTYFMSNGTDPSDNKGCIFQCEIDPKTGERLTESKPIWKGNGGRYLESPHLFHIGDWYYITAAEGGTEYGHMITYARGTSPYGPFESYPGNPVLTNRNQGGHENHIQGIGHGDLIQAENGETFLICLGFRQQSDWMPFHHLGREVFLVPVQWTEDGWFTAGEQGLVKEEMEINLDAVQDLTPGRYDVSIETLGPDSVRWCHLREFEPEYYEIGEHSIRLKGNHFTLNDVEAPVFLGVRQSEFYTQLQVTVSGNASEAGVSFYLSEDHHYDVAVCMEQGVRTLICRICCGDARQIVFQKQLPENQTETMLRVISDETKYTFFGECGGEMTKLGQARTKYLSSEVAGGFTGTLMGMYAVNEEGSENGQAEFTNLSWKQRHSEAEGLY